LIKWIIRAFDLKRQVNFNIINLKVRNFFIAHTTINFDFKESVHLILILLTSISHFIHDIAKTFTNLLNSYSFLNQLTAILTYNL